MVVPTIANNAVTAKMAKSIIHLLNMTDLLGTEVKSGSCILPWQLLFIVRWRL
jgi:hypothetical protein